MEQKMDRRKFLTSMLGLSGAVAGVALVTHQAQASTLLDRLTDIERIPQTSGAAEAADLPAVEAQEAWHRGAPHRGWVGRRRRVRRRRCVWRRTRSGRMVQVCRF